MKEKKQAITTPSLLRQGMTNKLLCVIVALLLWPASLWADTDTDYINNGKVGYGVGYRGFDIKFKYNDIWNSTTFGDGGYYTYISINGAEKKNIVNEGNQLVLGHTYTIDGIEVTITVSIPDDLTSTVNIQYIIKNTKSSEVSIKLGSCADTQVGENDKAKVYVQETDGQNPAAANGTHLTGRFLGNTTDINSLRLVDQDGSEQWYDLNGRRIDRPTKNGLYIHKGKKVTIK